MAGPWVMAQSLRGMGLEGVRERTHITKGFISSANQSDVYPGNHGEPREDFKQGSDVVMFAF